MAQAPPDEPHALIVLPFWQVWLASQQPVGQLEGVQVGPQLQPFTTMAITATQAVQVGKRIPRPLARTVNKKKARRPCELELRHVHRDQRKPVLADTVWAQLDELCGERSNLGH